MTDNVVDIDDYREHITVINGDVGHVVPVKTIVGYINGEHDLDPDLLKAIVQDWLECMFTGIA